MFPCSSECNVALNGRYLGCEHVSDPVGGALQEQSSDQEAEQHDVREQGAEVHHLPGKASVGRRVKTETGTNMFLRHSKNKELDVVRRSLTQLQSKTVDLQLVCAPQPFWYWRS